MDIASRYKGSYQLTSKNAKEVAQAFQWIYEDTPLNYPKTLIVDDGKEFYGDTTKLMEKHDVISTMWRSKSTSLTRNCGKVQQNASR